MFNQEDLAVNEFIYWIVSDENKALRIIWVDDVFLPPSDAEIGGLKVSSLGCGWLDAFLDAFSAENPDSLPDGMPFQSPWLLAIKNACEKKNVGFGVTSFEYCLQFLQEFNTEETLFLIEIENLYAENPEFYGYEFVKETQLPRERFRYYTVYGASITRARQLYFPYLSDEDYISPDIDTWKLEQWIDSFLIHYWR